MRRTPPKTRNGDLEVATVFTVEVIEDPRERRWLTGVAVDIRTDDGLAIWTPVLGPSCVLILRLLAAQPGRTWHIADIAGQLGLAVRWTRNALVRLERFGWLRAVESADESTTVSYRVFVASPLSAREVERIHPELAARYARLSGLAGAPTPAELPPA